MKKMCLLLRPQHAGVVLIPCTKRQLSIYPLEDHRVWPVGLAKAEAGAKVVDEMGFLLYVGKESLVNGLLICYAIFRSLLLLSTC